MRISQLMSLYLGEMTIDNFIFHENKAYTIPTELLSDAKNIMEEFDLGTKMIHFYWFNKNRNHDF